MTQRRQIRGIFLQEIKNQCCEDKPVLLMMNLNGKNGEDISYACECECGMWNTIAFRTPVEAIMAYEMMCRYYPKRPFISDPKMIKKYMKYYYNSKEEKRR